VIAPRADIALMSGYHSPQVDVDVRLNTNESPYPPPESWTAALAGALDDIDWHRYPDREARELRTRLGALHGVGPEHVFVANGSNEVLQTILLAYGGPGRVAAIFEPTYALHGHIARITGTEVVEGRRDDDFVLSVDEVERVSAAASPSITFLCSPNNPTGVVDDPAVIESVASSAPGLVVVDEAYGQFAPESALALVSDTPPANVVVTRTFSKTWSMAAGRLGYCIAPRSVVDQLHKVVLPYHLDAFKQLAGNLALDYVAEMEGRVAALVAERGRLAARLSEFPVRMWPSGANFLLFRPESRSGADVWQELVDRSILVRDCSSWPRLGGCLRVTIGTPSEDDAFLAALTEILT
jgi:histidinol-phosphate aminotransferase